MPLALDQGIGTLVWSPLGWARLTGKIGRGRPKPVASRLNSRRAAEAGPPVALNWLLQRPTVSSVIIGARDEAQLRDNLGAVGWDLTAAQVARLDAASATTPIYPYWQQWQFKERNRTPVG